MTSRRVFCRKGIHLFTDKNSSFNSRGNRECRTCRQIKRKNNPEREVWQGMKQRCYNSKSNAYYRYGGRGIKVCDRWLKFDNFLADMGRRPTDEHSIDRINNDGDYEPSNCRWTTRGVQSINRNTTKTTMQKQLILIDRLMPRAVSLRPRDGEMFVNYLYEALAMARTRAEQFIKIKGG